MNEDQSNLESQETWARELFTGLSPVEPTFSEAELMFRAGEAAGVQRAAEKQRQTRRQGILASLGSALVGGVATWFVMSLILNQEPAMPSPVPSGTQWTEHQESSEMQLASDQTTPVVEPQVSASEPRAAASGRWAMMMQVLEPALQPETSSVEPPSAIEQPEVNPETPYRNEKGTTQYELRRQWLTSLSGDLT